MSLIKQVAKVVQVARNRSTKQVIEDLMQMQCNLLTEPVFIEKVYPNTLYRYGEGFREELNYYKKDAPAWAELTKLSTMFLHAVAEAKPFTDHMGSLYDLELRGNTFGQFLTPPDLAELLGDLHMSLEQPITSPKTVGDDTGCGAGSLLLGYLRGVLRHQGKGAISMLHVVANDLDTQMVKICAVQIALNSIIHRIPLNSLTVHNCNIISEYMEMNAGKHVAFHWIPNAKMGYHNTHRQALQALETLSRQSQKLEAAYAHLSNNKRKL